MEKKTKEVEKSTEMECAACAENHDHGCACGFGCGCGMHKHHRWVHIVIKVLVLLVIFSAGVQLGEIKGELRVLTGGRGVEMMDNFGRGNVLYTGTAAQPMMGAWSGQTSGAVTVPATGAVRMMQISSTTTRI